MSEAGPNQVLSAEKYDTTEADGCVKLRIGGDELAADGDKPISVPGLLIKAADEAPDVLALATKRDDKWQKWTYKQYLSGKAA